MVLPPRLSGKTPLLGVCLGGPLGQTAKVAAGTPAVFPALKYQPAGSYGLGQTGHFAYSLDAQTEGAHVDGCCIAKAVPAGRPTFSSLPKQAGQRESLAYTLG